MSDDDDFKNALPDEVADDRSSDTPRELHTRADDEPALDARAAKVAGISPDSRGVYGDDSQDPNADDRRDVEGAE
jgi:hypothetical protein